MKCNRNFPARKKKGILLEEARVCDGDIRCIDVYSDMEKGYCYCNERCCGGHDLPRLAITYKCSKCDSKEGPINDAYELVDVINHYLDCMK